MDKNKMLGYLEEYQQLEKIKETPYTSQNDKVSQLLMSFLSPLIVLVIVSAAVVGVNMIEHDFSQIWQTVVVNKEVFGLIVGLFYLFSVASHLERLHKKHLCDKKRLKKIRKSHSKDFLKKFELEKGNLEQIVQKADKDFTEYAMFLKYNRFFLANVMKTMKEQLALMEKDFDISSEQELDNDSKKTLIEWSKILLNEHARGHITSDSEQESQEPTLLPESDIETDSSDMLDDVQEESQHQQDLELDEDDDERQRS